MNEHKGVNATRRSIRRDCRRAIGAERHLVADCEVRRHKRGQDTGCQVDARDGVICTCRTKVKRHEPRYFSIEPEQVYAYHGVSSYTNIGVGDVKTIHRRKVKKIYLPAMDERGVGSSEVSSVTIREHSNTADSYYVPKTTSSKCVGGFWQPVVNVLSEKLSAVVKCLYATTGLDAGPPNHQKVNIEIGNNTENKKFATTTQVECEVKVKPERSDRPLSTKEQREIANDKSAISPNAKVYLEGREEDKFSSDSLLQHVHDLEHPQSVSQEKPTKASLDPMEKKVEKEYRQMFASTKSKNPSIVKSKSLLRRRFEALRRGHKKEDAKKKDVDSVSSSPANIGHKAIKDVPIVFDLPFLEAESNYDEKPHARSNPPNYDKASFRQSVTGGKKCLDSPNNEENEFEQGVSGLEKNLEEDTRTATKISSDATKDTIYEKTLPDNKDADKKAGGIKFSFFKKRSKDKAKCEKTDKTKKVPANCCEVKHGLVHKTLTNSDAYNTLTPNNNADDTDNHEDIQRKAWLRKFLTSSINSRDSVKIRWNNKTYATSSSTVFRIVDNVYKETGIVIRSKSDIQMNSSYKSSGKKGNFVNQHIEAWMVPKTITDMPTFITMNIFSTAQKEHSTKKEKGVSKHKQSADKAKTFSLNMKGEVVLRSNHKVQHDEEKTSNFLRIEIPDDYFSESCDEENRGISDEKVYNIVEYETLKSNFDLKTKSNFDTGDHTDNGNTVIVDKKDSKEIESRVLQTVIKNPPIHNDGVVQDSNVDFPKRCDVIEVGVLTQKDIIDFKPILKLEDDFSGYESSSNHFNPTGCEFAQSYLQEYYSQWMPLEVIQSSWRNSNTTLIQDGSKSCPNVCDEYHPSTLISPSHSSCSHCHNLFDDEYRNKILYGYVTSLVKSGKCKEAKTDPATTVDKQTEVKKGDTDSKKKKEKVKKENKDIRILPKDSLEVFKRRQLYAMSNKSRWLCPHKAPCPMPDGKPCDKRVSMVDEGSNPCPSNKLLEGIINYKKAACKTDQPKKVLKLGSHSEIPPNDPPCKEKCEKMKKAPCDKNTEPCPPRFIPTPCPSPPPEPACKKSCEKMKTPACDQHTKPCPPKPPTRQCQIPPPDPACKRHCEKMKQPPCDKNTQPCPPPTFQCDIPSPEAPCKKNCEKIKKPLCNACSNPPSSPCPAESKSSFNSSEPKINYKFTIEGSSRIPGNMCNKHTEKCPQPPDPACLTNQAATDQPKKVLKLGSHCEIPPNDPPCKNKCEQMKKAPCDKNTEPCPPRFIPTPCPSPPPEPVCKKSCEKMKNTPCDNCSEPCPPSPPPVPRCNICIRHSPSEPRCDKNCEKIKKCSKKVRSEPPCTAECLNYQFSERSINCMISFEKPAAYDTCKKSPMKSIEPLKMAAQCETPSPPHPACQKKCNKMRKPPYDERSQTCPPPSPPSESQSDSDSSKSSERSSIVTFEVSTSYDTCRKLPMKCPKHPDSSCQKKNSMPCFPSPGSESPCPSERNAPASQFPERSTNCMMSYEKSTGYDASKKRDKPFILGPKYDVIVVPPDSAYQKEHEKTKKPPKEKKLRLPPPSPPSESPHHSECNASPSQFSERSANGMMSVEGSSDDDTSNNLEESTKHDMSKYPQHTGYKTYKVRPKHDIIPEPPDRAYQKKYEKTKKPSSYKMPYPPSPPPESPSQSECNAAITQYSDRSINCSMSFEESTGYDCYDTSQNPPEKKVKPYKQPPNYDTVEPPDSVYQKVLERIEKLRNKTSKPSPRSPSPPSESPCPSEYEETAPQFSDRSINCMMSYEETSEDDTSNNFEEFTEYDTSTYPPELVTSPYNVGPNYEIVVIPPNSEYQKKYEKNKKPPIVKKLRLPPPSPPSESPCHSEYDEPASQFSERSISCMMSFEEKESAGKHTSQSPPEQGTKPYKLSPKYDIVVIPPSSEYERKNEKTKKPQEEDKKSKPSPPDGSPHSSRSSKDSRFSERNTNCMISYEGCHKPSKMGPQYDIVVVPPDSTYQKKNDKIKKAPPDENSMPSPASPKQGPKTSNSSAASLISDCMITYHDIPGFSTSNLPPTKCAKPQKKCNTVNTTCDKSRMPCPPSPLESPCPSRTNSVCSVRDACSSPPPCPAPKCSNESPSYRKESGTEVRLSCSSHNDSFCVKKYPSKMKPLLGCQVRPPPKCSTYPLPSCSPPPKCNKYPPPGCSPPPKCNKYASCSPPPMCNKYPPPSCSPPPICNKYPRPGCSPPPRCNKYSPPGCFPPPKCNKYSPPGCFPPPKCNKYSPPACFPPPKCNKYSPPACFPPPKCNKYSPPGCFPPPKCNKYSPPGCFPPPKCTKIPGCYKPPKCPTSEKGCDPFRKCGSQMFPPPSPCPRPSLTKRCVLPPRPCRFPPHLCRPHSAPICPTMARRTPCLNDPGPCRLCAQSYPCPVSPIPLCSSKLSDCFKCPREGLFLKKLPCPRKTCIPKFPCKREFDMCSPRKSCVKTTLVEDGSGRNPNYSCSQVPPTPCLSECRIKRAVDMFEPCADEIGWIKLMQRSKLRGKKNKNFVENCSGPNTVDEQRVPSRRATTIKNKCVSKKPATKTMTFMDKCPARVDEARSVQSRLLGDMYQPSLCQRVSTKDAQIVNTLPKLSSQSLDNIMELQFKMKIIQGDKTTEINLGKDGEEKEMQMLKSSCRDDYVVNNTATSLQEQVASSDMTNGVNIHIVINNFKRKDKNQHLTAETDQDERCKIHDDFANKICQKFHTVSTVYSDGIQSDVNQKDAYSAQKNTWNLTGCSEKSKIQPSGDVSDLSHNKDIKKFTISQNPTSVTELVNKFDTATEVKSCLSQKVGDAKSKGAEVKEEEEKEIAKVIYNADELDKKPSTNKTDLCNNASSDNLKAISNHGEKKSNLKIAVEKAGKVLHKNKVSKLTKLFKAIVKTSESSENAEMTVTDNDLTEDKTLASVNPNSFRNTDSMNNYYKLSAMTSDNEDCCYKHNTSLTRDPKCGIGTCVCTTFAAKLNMLGQGGCPCSSPGKTYVDIDTNCDIRTDKDQVLSNSPSDYLDAATQRSRFFISRANSANVSNNNITVKGDNALSNIESKQINPGTYISSHHTKVKSFSVNISPVVNQIGIEKECKMRKFHRETVSSISDDDKIIANMQPKRDGKQRDAIIAHMEPMRIRVETTEESAEEYFKEKSIKANAPADVLQSYETKKAVLEIYTERTVCDGRKHLVAKLPKFTIERESEIIKYEKICKRSIVMSFES